MSRPVAIVLAAALAGPAIAAAVAYEPRHEWGQLPPSVAVIRPSEVAEAELTITNNLSAFAFPDYSFVVALDGLEVGVIVAHGPYTDPDFYTITVPLGYEAVPNELTLDEGQTGTVLIQLVPMG